MVPFSFCNLAATSCVEKFRSFSVAVFVKDTRFSHLKQLDATFPKPEISKTKNVFLKKRRYSKLGKNTGAENTRKNISGLSRYLLTINIITFKERGTILGRPCFVVIKI